MPCEKHGPRASVTTKTSAFGLGFCLLSPSGHVFHTAWETMIKSYSISQIAKFMGPTWGPPGSCGPHMGPMLAPWTLLSGWLFGVQAPHVSKTLPPMILTIIIKVVNITACCCPSCTGIHLQHSCVKIRSNFSKILKVDASAARGARYGVFCKFGYCVLPQSLLCWQQCRALRHETQLYYLHFHFK